MISEQERQEWRHDSEHIERHADDMVQVLKDSDAIPVAYMAIDFVHRPFLQWLHSAQVRKEDAVATRNSAIHLINMMILEVLSRMNVQGLEHAVDWVDDFIELLMAELDEDLRLLMRRLQANDNTRGGH